MVCSVDLSFTNLILVGALVCIVKKAIQFYKQWQVEKLLSKWNNTPRDKLILHTTWRCKQLPSISPFALKLETYLRVAKITNYEIDTVDSRGPKGKIPWITLNSTHVTDSQLCIEFLRKKYNVDLNGKHSAEELGKARACRILLEDRFVWGLVHYRWIENIRGITQLAKWPPILKFMLPLISRDIKKRMITNGIGMHTPSQIYQMTEDDLRAVSVMLGNKKYICGDEPCEDDCAIFGMLSQVLWGVPGSSFERLAQGELSNLKLYCERMQANYWPDWESCLDKM